MHDRNIIFKKNKREYFLNDFAQKKPRNKIKKRKPVNGFYVKNKTHRNHLIKKTYKAKYSNSLKFRMPFRKQKMHKKT